MNLATGSGSSVSRRLVLLAPPGADTSSFTDVRCDRAAYDEVLEDAQRFRAQVHVEERLLELSDLTSDGRHVQNADYKGWHLVTLNDRGSVEACSRVLVYDSKVSFSQLSISQSSLAHCDRWGWLLKRAIENQIDEVSRRDLPFCELGGWAVSPTLRSGAEAVRMVLGSYALGGVLGGVAGISTLEINTAAPILRRMGARPLKAGKSHDLNVLQFDSSQPNPDFAARINQVCAQLRSVTVIAGGPSKRWNKTADFFATMYSASKPPSWPRTAVVAAGVLSTLMLGPTGAQRGAQFVASSMLASYASLPERPFEFQEPPPLVPEPVVKTQRPYPVEPRLTAYVPRAVASKRFVPPPVVRPVVREAHLDRSGLPFIPTPPPATPVSAEFPKLQPPKRSGAARFFKACATPFKALGSAFKNRPLTEETGRRTF